jgi:hypothetical protein
MCRLAAARGPQAFLSKQLPALASFIFIIASKSYAHSTKNPPLKDELRTRYWGTTDKYVFGLLRRQPAQLIKTVFLVLGNHEFYIPYMTHELQKHLDVTPYLFPDDSLVVAPHTWPTDLQTGNSFVDKRGRFGTNAESLAADIGTN